MNTGIYEYTLVDITATGVWCERCALPSAVDTVWAPLDQAGLPACLHESRLCVDCGQVSQP